MHYRKGTQMRPKIITQLYRDLNKQKVQYKNPPIATERAYMLFLLKEEHAL